MNAVRKSLQGRATGEAHVVVALLVRVDGLHWHRWRGDALFCLGVVFEPPTAVCFILTLSSAFCARARRQDVFRRWR